MRYLVPNAPNFPAGLLPHVEPELDQLQLAFPPLPRVPAMLFNIDEVNNSWPYFCEFVADAATLCIYPDEPICFIAPRFQLGNGRPYSGFGDALVIVLGKAFEPHLTALAVQQPRLYTLLSLDYKYLVDVFDWSVDTGGVIHALLLYGGHMYHYIQRLAGGGQQSVCWVPIVFVAGDSVASTGFWFDAEVEGSMQAAQFIGVNYRPRRHFDEAELASAKDHADSVGSLAPWESSWWAEDSRRVARVRMIALPEQSANQSNGEQ